MSYLGQHTRKVRCRPFSGCRSLLESFIRYSVHACLIIVIDEQPLVGCSKTFTVTASIYGFNPGTPRALYSVARHVHGDVEAWPVLPRAAAIGPRMLVRLKSLHVRSNAEGDVTRRTLHSCPLVARVLLLFRDASACVQIASFHSVCTLYAR